MTHLNIAAILDVSTPAGQAANMSLHFGLQDINREAANGTRFNLTIRESRGIVGNGENIPKEFQWFKFLLCFPFSQYFVFASRISCLILTINSFGEMFTQLCKCSEVRLRQFWCRTLRFKSFWPP